MPRGFWFASFAFTVAMLGTTLPTPLYPIYERTFGITPVLVTVVFAVYAFGVLLTLLWLGHLSDDVGRRPVLFAGLILSALSALVFVFANGIWPMLAGRVLSGISAGLFTGTATAALVDMAGETRRKHAAMVAVAANVGGLGLGTLLSGALADAASAPLQVPFRVDLALVALAFAALLAVPETVTNRSGKLSLSLRRLYIPSEIRGTFLRAAVAGASAFAVSGMLSAIAPLFLTTSLHVRGHLTAGLVTFVLFLATALGQTTVDRFPVRFALVAGCGTLLIGTALLAAALVFESLAGIFTASAVIGYGQGIVMGFGLAQINARVRERRGEVSSTYFVLLYAGLAIPVIVAGFLSRAFGLRSGSLALCGAVALAVACVLIAFLRTGPDPAESIQRA